MLEHNLAIAAAITGFGLGTGAIFSIGPQNLKLIQSGASRCNAATVAVTGYISEIVIVTAGVCGLGAALQTIPPIKLAMQVAGVMFLLWCALRAFGTKRLDGEWHPRSRAAETPMQAVRSMLLTTWLNPLVYTECMLLVGVFSSGYDGSSHLWFAVGFLSASALRFCGLPTIGRVLAPWLVSARAQSAFDRVAGSLLLVVAASQAVTIK